jgi:response regulator RpfG family c-di-GMP phosphodiesterase
MVDALQRQRTLLLVDDEPNIVNALKRTLRRDGYRILTANCAEEGLGLLAEHEVGVILSDQRMPVKTGVEFLREVKQLYPKTMRIVLSGYTELESVTNAINEGAIYKFLTKPWDDDLLLKNIREAFEYHEMEQENQRLTQELQFSNQELSRLNQNLEQQVYEKTREIMHNMTMLEVSQEIFEHLPVAIIGIDQYAMIAAANKSADKLFGGQQGGCLLGMQAKGFLPKVLLELLDKAQSEATQELIQLPDGSNLQVWICPMGDSSLSKGTIIVVSPHKESDGACSQMVIG